MIKTLKTVGVEIEVERPSPFYGSPSRILELNPRWEHHHDGSLDNGDEYVTRGGLSFKEMDDELKKVLPMLNDLYVIKKTCGFHVHYGFKNDERKFRMSYLYKTLLAYYQFEEFFFKMLPKSRQMNRFCYKLHSEEGCNNSRPDFYMRELIRNPTPPREEFIKSFYYNPDDMRAQYYKKRYYWVNVHSYFLRGTIEIRAHQGTMDYVKIKNWIEINRRFIEWAMNQSLTTLFKIKPSAAEFRKIIGEQLYAYYIERRNYFENREEVKVKPLFKQQGAIENTASLIRSVTQNV
jgi:hypothetical protein